MWSFDLGEIEALQHAGRWDDAFAGIIVAAQGLERGGPDFVVTCTNTMHCMADQMQVAIRLLLHIVDSAADGIKAAGFVHNPSDRRYASSLARWPGACPWQADTCFKSAHIMTF